MSSFVKKFALMAMAVAGASMLYAAPAAAQATRTWISGVGDDANPCSRTAPCKTFAGAISKTAAGGEINCLHPGGFGAVTITKAISIICDNTEGGVLVASTNAFNINAADTDVVTISGLDILGPTTVPGLSGINFLNGAGVNIRNTTIKGMATQGVNFTPGAGKTSFLHMENVTITGNGTVGNTATGGINIAPGSNATANVVINNVRVQDNANMGLRLDLTGTTGSKINAQATDSLFNSDGIGIFLKALTGTGTINAQIDSSTISNNVSYGIAANGSGATGRFSNNTITGNGSGGAATNAGVASLNSATLSSYGNNRLDGNFNNAGAAANGAFSGTISTH